MLQSYRLTITAFLLAIAASAQPSHRAQLDQMREIDRQQARDQHERTAQQRQAQALTQQEDLAQQAQQQKQPAAPDQAEPEQPPRTQPLQLAAPAPQQQLQPAATPGWSWKNMSTADKLGLAALGVLLAALAFAARNAAMPYGGADIRRS